MSTSNGSSGRRGLPRGPHGLTPDEVARNQRERLIAAMTEAVGDIGYSSTHVAEVIQRAGVSRKTFYVHFEDRRDCLMAAYETAAAETLRSVQEAAGRKQAARSRLPATIAAICDAAASSPSSYRLQVSEIAAGGRSALLAREQLIAALAQLMRDGLSPSAQAPPMTLMELISDGLLRVIERRVLDGELDDPERLADELARWARSYHPAPVAIFDGHGRLAGDPLPSRPMPIGGRAPGTLSLSSRRASDGGRGVSTSFTAHNQRERILDAVANLCAANGYVALTVDEVVSAAGVSLNTFYEHFDDKDDALLVAHELGHMRGTSVLQQALDHGQSWELAVRNGIAALLDFFSSEPAFARVAAIDAPIASRQVAERSYAYLSIYADLLLDGAPRSRRPPAVAGEAIAASLHAAVFAYAVHGLPQNLAMAYNHATYLVLAPFLGPQKAFD